MYLEMILTIVLKDVFEKDSDFFLDKDMEPGRD